jgi:hypothetical protein
MAALEGRASILRLHAARREDGALDDPAAHGAWEQPPARVLLTGNGTLSELVAAPPSITPASSQQAFRPGAVGDGTGADGAVVDGAGDGAAVSVGAAAGGRAGDVGAAAGAGVLGGVQLGVPSGPGLRTITARGWPTTMRRLTT